MPGAWEALGGFTGRVDRGRSSPGDSARTRPARWGLLRPPWCPALPGWLPHLLWAPTASQASHITSLSLSKPAYPQTGGSLRPEGASPLPQHVPLPASVILRSTRIAITSSLGHLPASAQALPFQPRSGHSWPSEEDTSLDAGNSSHRRACTRVPRRTSEVPALSSHHSALLPGERRTPWQRCGGHTAVGSEDWAP